MTIDRDPKNGDFARYIDNLSRAGGSMPEPLSGKAETKRQTSAPFATATPAPSRKSLNDPTWGKAASPPPSPQAEPAPQAAAEQKETGTVSLAQHARQRKKGVFLTLLGAGSAWIALDIVLKALRAPYFELRNLIAAVFFGFFALMLFKAAKDVRAPRRRPLEKLPPLKTSSYRKKG